MNDKYLAELREQIRFIASDFRPNEFEPEKPIQHCRLNRKKVDQIMEAVVAALAKQDRESLDKGQLIGVAKILNSLWENSYYALGEAASKRIEREMIYYFGEDWPTEMYKFMLEDGESKPSIHPADVCHSQSHG